MRIHPSIHICACVCTHLHQNWSFHVFCQLARPEFDHRAGQWGSLMWNRRVQCKCASSPSVSTRIKCGRPAIPVQPFFFQTNSWSSSGEGRCDMPTLFYHNILHNAFDAIGNMFLEINPKTELCWSAQEQEGWLQHKYPRQNMQTWAELLYPTHFSSERNIWFARYTARAKHNKANSRKWLLAWFCFYNNCWDCWQLTSWRFILWLLNMKSQSWFPTSSAQLGPVVADCPAMSFVFGTLPKKTKRENVGILKNRGGVFPNPTSFVIWPSDFLHAKIILRC